MSGGAWSFVGAILKEPVEIYRALHINAIDVLALPGFLLDSDKIIENPSHTALTIKELGVPVVNLMFNFAVNFSDRALNQEITSNSVVVTLDNRAHNPYLVASGLAGHSTPMPWFGNKKLIIQFA